MKSSILCLAIAGAVTAGYGQITLETIYQGASQKLYMVSLETSGQKYVVKSDAQNNRYLKFYNLNHSLWKNVDCNAMPTTTMIAPGNTVITQNLFDALYITEKLFNCDEKLEFMYVSTMGNRWFTGIYDENGTALLIADSTAPLCKLNIENQYKPVYNTSAGTKLILSHQTGHARVYSLPCPLSPTTGLEAAAPKPVSPGSLSAYPNPAFHETTINYSLPEGVGEAEIVVTDLSGRTIVSYRVDNNFSTLLLPRNEVSSGTYVYTLIAGGRTLESKKIVLLD